MARTKQRTLVKTSLELTPLIDVVFLLLIFFMLATTFAKVITKLDIKLPKARAVGPQTDVSEAVIEITVDGILAFNGKVMSLEELDQTLAELGRKKPDQAVVIKGDQMVNYGQIIKVMGLCKSNNLEKLGMAALPEEY